MNGGVLGYNGATREPQGPQGRHHATLGFGSMPVLISVVGESLFLALVGGVIGATLAYVGFNGYQASTMNWQTFSQVAFGFAVTPKLLITGLVYALAMGLLASLIPAIRAANLPISKALREL